MDTDTVSPFCKNTGGFLAAPTPWGVPVRMTVSSCSVVPCERKAIIFGTLKIISEVFELCITLPFTEQLISNLFGSLISFAGTSFGPNGQNVSNVLPRHHWPPPFLSCQSRADTSLAM